MESFQSKKVTLSTTSVEVLNWLRNDRPFEIHIWGESASFPCLISSDGTNFMSVSTYSSSDGSFPTGNNPTIIYVPEADSGVEPVEEFLYAKAASTTSGAKLNILVQPR